MRVFMISKACVVGIYQRKLEEMARLPGVDLAVLVPPLWADPAGAIPLERAHTQGYQLLVDPIRFNGNYHLHFYPTLARRLREFRPDVLHIDEEPYNFATWHALWSGRRAKTLFFSWQNIARRYPPPFSLGEAWTLRRVDYALMGTQSAAEVWRAKGYRGPLAIIPQFGIDPELFRPSADPRPERPLQIGFVGRLVPEKCADLLIRAVHSLGQSRLNVEMVVIGQGPERQALEALATALGIADRVVFRGVFPSTQMPTLYPLLDVLVVPSRTQANWKEQFGRVIVEAMASGVPVIGSDSGAIPDVIGDGGLIFPEGDHAALTAALRDLAENPAQRAALAARGRQRVVDHFTHASLAKQTIAVYQEMLQTSQK